MTTESKSIAITATEREINTAIATKDVVKRELYVSYVSYEKSPNSANFRKLTSCMLTYQEQATKIISLQEKLSWLRQQNQ